METERIIPRIEGLTIKNYRVLKHLQLKNITPLTVFLGPNGSGKSTILDVFAFLSECFSVGLKKAWDKRNRFREMRTRGTEGPIVIELKYREGENPPQPNPIKYPLITYHLSINEENNNPYIEEEFLRWKRQSYGYPLYILRFKKGVGHVIGGEIPESKDEKIEEKLESPDIIAVSTLGQFSKHPRVSALRRFITDWYLSYITADSTRTTPDSGPQEHLSKTGDNLPNVIQYLSEQHPTVLEGIFDVLSVRVPRLEKIESKLMEDGRLLLQIKDAPFERPILSKFASDGTLKMLAYLTVLQDPNPLQLIGIEEPENQLHPRLLPELAEECRKAASRSQLLISTHSPEFINTIRPEELWILDRDENGFTKAKKAVDMQGIKNFLQEGATPGYLWMESYFEWGDPIDSAKKTR